MKGWLTRTVNAMFPWPARGERRARVAEATAEATRARRRAATARKLEDDLRRILADNHFAQIIYRGIAGDGEQEH